MTSDQQPATIDNRPAPDDRREAEYGKARRADDAQEATYSIQKRTTNIK